MLVVSESDSRGYRLTCMIGYDFCHFLSNGSDESLNVQ
jgi:hypothetical protein